jgi:GMP synthase (glutamine-hydrolysing)
MGIADSDSCKFEMIRHVERNIFGTQFHPEMSSDGKSLLNAFVLL